VKAAESSHLYLTAVLIDFDVGDDRLKDVVAWPNPSVVIGKAAPGLARRNLPSIALTSCVKPDSETAPQRQGTSFN
jgi:hypothetical protein